MCGVVRNGGTSVHQPRHASPGRPSALHAYRIHRRDLKAYENDGVHFPSDATGAIEGQRVSRYWTARAVFDRRDVSSAYQTYTDTTSGSDWCTAVVDRTPAGLFSMSVGAPLHPGEVDARTRDKGALHVQVPRSRLLFTADRGPGHPLRRTGVAQRPGAFTPAGRHAA
jgi:hypothetical protein